MDVSERWRLASDSADRFSPFRRRHPVHAALVTASVASISLVMFLMMAGLDIGQFWAPALASIIAVTLAGYGVILLSNYRARSSYIAEYCRLNKVDTPS